MPSRRVSDLFDSMDRNERILFPRSCALRSKPLQGHGGRTTELLGSRLDEDWGPGTMSEPVIAQRMPYAVELESGDYWWCRCGRSQNQPFCDGSHKDTAFTPDQGFARRGRKGLAVRLQAQRQCAVLRRHAQDLGVDRKGRPRPWTREARGRGSRLAAAESCTRIGRSDSERGRYRVSSMVKRSPSWLA